MRFFLFSVLRVFGDVVDVVDEGKRERERDPLCTVSFPWKGGN